MTPRSLPGKSPADNLLCVKLASRGDLLLAAPAFARLRRMRPTAHLGLLVGASCEDVARHLAYFDEIRILDDRALFSSARRERLRGAWQMLRALQGSQAREVLIFHRDWRYGVLARLAGIPLRRGFASPRGSRFLTHPYAAGAREHHVHQYLGMAGLLTAGEAGETATLAGLWRFAPGERERALTAAAAQGFAPQAGPWVALGFGGGNNVKTRTEVKRWPLGHFRALAVALTARGCGVVWLGDAEDGRALGAGGAGVNLAGVLSVAESAAVLSACAVAVANDTLLLHLAQAVGTPAVGLFGPTDPAHYQPLAPGSRTLWRGPAAVPCSPCHRDGYFPPCGFEHRCLRGIEVETVTETVTQAVAEALAQTAGVGAVAAGRAP